jgi:Domain of unknown function (DUF5666)
MNRIALATLLAVLCLPASALAARSTGVVLSVSSAQRTIQVIGRTHAVGGYHYRGRLPGVRRGSRISFSRSGQRIADVRMDGARATRLTFSGTVVHAGAGAAVVRLADGDTVRLSSIRVRGLGGRTLTDGSEVLVTETMGSDPHTTVTITRLGAGSRSRGGSSSTPPGQVQAIGTVVEIDPTSFVLQVAGGADLRFDITPAQLYDAQMSLCNVVSVLYEPGDMAVTSDDLSFADNSSTSGQCADPGPPSEDGANDAIGPITQLTLSSVTISTATGPMRFAATIDLSSDFLVGDTVDVSYAPGSNGTPIATDIEYDDYDAIGTVTAVSAGSVTITDSSTDQSRTFTDDPSNDTFAGISVGDDVDVSYYYSNGQIVVDYVTDLSTS